MTALGPFSFDVLTHPWILLLLIGVLGLLAAEWAAQPAGAVTVSTGDTLARIRGKSKALLRRTPAILRAVGLAFLIIALARPLTGISPRIERADIIDIMLVVDVSGSMTQEDFIVGDRRRDRLYVTKEVVRDFIESRKAKSTDRYGLDRIGLILFAAYAWMQTPLTLDYGVLQHDLERVVIDENDDKSHRTAIGSAIGLAVSKLSKSEAKSKVVILLTDGINNHGNLDPITAAQIAKEYGIRVYPIGAGAAGGRVTRNTLLGPIVQTVGEPIDEASMKRIAEITGGKYYRATDMQSLRQAYEEIGRLETTEVELGDLYDYRDGFMPYALAGLAALSVSLLGRRQWFDPVP